MNNIKRFSCNICNRTYATESSLKGHKRQKHSDCLEHSHQHELEKQTVPYCDHLFCFVCKKFLRTQTDITSHRCKPTRLLSRKWYKEATWIRNKYTCKICSDEPYHCKDCLEEHMYKHMYNRDERLSRLFQFVPPSSNQTEHLNGLGMTGRNSSSVTCHRDTQQPMWHFCDICNQMFTTLRHLKGHKTRMHSGNSTTAHQETRQNCPYSDHLYCFNCKNFLKSQTEISRHKCKTTRILSRFWYSKAVWAKNQYQCKYCSDKFFHSKNPLEKHMFTHEKRTSQLFRFLPSSSNQTEGQHMDVRNTTDDISFDTSYQYDDCEVTIEPASEDECVELLVNEETRPSYMSVESTENTSSKPAEENKSSGDLICESCNSKFWLPDLFTAHVMMYPNCLMFYEKLESESPALVPFCFKCKRIKTDIIHRCRGVVSIMYTCALCRTMSPDIYNLIEHEKEKHPVAVKDEPVETIQTGNDTIFINISTV